MKRLAFTLAIALSTLVGAQGLTFNPIQETEVDSKEPKKVMISQLQIEELKNLKKEIKKLELDRRIEMNSVLIPRSEINKLKELQRKLKEN